MSGSATLQMALLKLLGGGECLSVDALDERLAMSRKAIVHAAARLVSRGFVERVTRGCFQLTSQGREFLDSGELLTSGPKGPLTQPFKQRRNTLRERLWRALRIQARGGAVTVGDLLVNALAGGERNGTNNAQKYLKALEAAGLVRRMPRKGSRGQSRWVLANNTGPKAPVLQAENKRLFDPNTGQSHDLVNADAGAQA